MNDLIKMPGVRAFWTGYDPLDLAADSIDPLGFLSSYLALADCLLPGFTTVTSVPRYTGMLCWAISRILPGNPGSISPGTRRMAGLEQIQRVERAWALACGLAQQTLGSRAGAAEGVRGIRAVNRWLARHQGHEKLTLQFELLTSQIRYGGLGAYSTFLESLHLADMTALTLRPLGQQLAAAFPSPDPHGVDVRLATQAIPVAGLAGWGEQCHASVLSQAEAAFLRTALCGSEEADQDDHARWAMLRLLASTLQDGQVERTLLEGCDASLSNGTDNQIRDTAIQTRLHSALRIISPFEELYQCAQYLFDTLRHVAGISGRAPLDAVETSRCRAANTQATRAGRRLLAELERALDNGNALETANEKIVASGLRELAKVAAVAPSAAAFAVAILDRHHRVQQGKYGGTLPKAAWLRLELGGEVHLTAQRFGLLRLPGDGTWRSMPRHPYRTEAARPFIRLCRIR